MAKFCVFFFFSVKSLTRLFPFGIMNSGDEASRNMRRRIMYTKNDTWLKKQI